MHECMFTDLIKKVFGPLYLGLPANENLTITFQYNNHSRQCSSNVLIPSK